MVVFNFRKRLLRFESDIKVRGKEVIL
jgi:hypothetical protein